MAIIRFIADLFGISIFRLVAYAGIAVVVAGGLVVVRQHYINKGYASAIAAVKKQDDRAVSAANKVEQRAADCTARSAYWDVISQGCKLEDEP
ncbi:MAG: hypothetical protein GC182_08460 [Rhodopseudomonas sp.]|nr:hypothetical protein [Rhodopseudomonas sp.]